MKLNEELTNLTKTNTSLKEQLEESKAEAENYKSLVVGLQRKILKIQHEAFENEKLRQSSFVPVLSSPLQVVDSKQTVSTFPSKPTLTRYFQGDTPLSGRTTFHSV
jgi:predicted  nucleic acid-binding Zn-ribbon protein